MKIPQALKSFILLFSTYTTWKLHKINVDLTLYRIQIHRNCIKNDQMTKSPPPPKKKIITRQKFGFRIDKKNNKTSSLVRHQT